MAAMPNLDDLKYSGISTDTRTIRRGELFIAIKGKNFDGNRFVQAALEKGAAAAIISRKLKLKTDKPVIKVKNTLKTLHQIAKAHRKKFNIPFIGVTGSSGKTTTKDMLASILSKAGKTLKTEENFNNEIGVPKTLFQLRKGHRFAVIEMAMQGVGEIGELAWIVEPKVAVITNIGSSHLEYLKSRQNIAKAKSEILKFQKRNDIAVLPSDDEYFRFLKSRSKGKVISFGLGDDADVRASNIEFQSERSIFNLVSRGMDVKIELPLPGKHNIYDALAAAAAAIALKIDQAKIKNGLESFRLSGKRTNIIHAKHITVIDDTYNANPDSMSAALEMLENYPGRRIAVLGDMFELGKASKASHEKIGALAKELGIDVLITVGKMMKLARGAHHFSSTGKVLKKLRSIVKPADTVLVKGSRGMHMEEIVKGLIR